MYIGSSLEVTPHGVGRCPKGQGDRSVRAGKPVGLTGSNKTQQEKGCPVFGTALAAHLAQLRSSPAARRFASSALNCSTMSPGSGHLPQGQLPSQFRQDLSHPLHQLRRQDQLHQQPRRACRTSCTGSANSPVSAFAPVAPVGPVAPTAPSRRTPDGPVAPAAPSFPGCARSASCTRSAVAPVA